MSCIVQLTDIRLSDGTLDTNSVSDASYCTAIDLVYDSTNHTINITLTKIERFSRDCVGVIGGPT